MIDGDSDFAAQLRALAAAADVLPCLQPLPALLTGLHQEIVELRQKVAELSQSDTRKLAWPSCTVGVDAEAIAGEMRDLILDDDQEKADLKLMKEMRGDIKSSKAADSKPQPLGATGVRYFFKGQKASQGKVVALDESATITAGAARRSLAEAGVDLSRFAAFVHSDAWQGWHDLSADDESAVSVLPRVQEKGLPDLMCLDVLLEERPSFTTRAMQALRLDAPEGYFGIGIIRGKTLTNHGVLWRSAFQMGSSFTFTVGARYEQRRDGMSDRYRCAHQCPQWSFSDFADFTQNAPMGAPLVAVEMGGVPLDSFEHPDRAIYLLGSEDGGLPTSVLQACHSVVSLPSLRAPSFNVAVAGSVVMYDRLAKERARQLHASSENGAKPSASKDPSAMA